MVDPNMIYEATYEVGTYDIDSQSCLSIPALTKMMHECAVQNVIKLKLSYWDLTPHQISWVLMRKRMQFIRRPKLGEKIRIVTYPAGFEKFYSYRDFKVYDENDQLITEASSTWLLIHNIKRRMATIPDFIKSKEMPNKIFLPRPTKKIPLIETVEFSKSYQVSWLELDWNDHLNNIHYLIKMLDVLPYDIYKNNFLSQIDIIFKMEAKYDDHIVSEAQVCKEEEISFLHRIVKKDIGKDIAVAKTTWTAYD